MSILRGEDVIVGVGVEGNRGVGVAPQMYIPATTPSGIAPIVEKIQLKETRGSKIASHASEVRQIRVEGDIESYVRAHSIGFFLKSFFGKVTSTAKVGDAAVTEHLFEVLPQNPEHPSLTIAISQPNLQDYYYSLAVAVSMAFEISTEDAVKVVNSLIASSETEKTAPPYAPTFSADDVLFRHQDVSIKLAANVAGLAAAPALSVKNFKLELPNGGRADQNVGEENIGNVLATSFEMKGSFELDLENTDLHDAYVDNDYQALQITLERADVTIGNTSHPSLVYTFPRIAIANWKPNRPIDDVVREAIDFSILFDASEAKAVSALLTNTRANYDAAEIES